MLNNHPAVGSVAVVGMPDREFGEKTCAYVTPKPGQSFAFEDMTEFLLGKNIAKYKLPERLEIVDAMPTVGDSGKINKEDLKKDIIAKLEAEQS
jgi:non-ribosomal peptide synthetase component E (peptide arylation enzyme)